MKLFKRKRKRYWYQVKYYYKKKPAESSIFSWNSAVGLTNQKDILNSRVIKQSLEPIHTNKFMKPFLCNGVIDIEILSYLGKF